MNENLQTIKKQIRVQKKLIDRCYKYGKFQQAEEGKCLLRFLDIWKKGVENGEITNHFDPHYFR